MEEGNHALAIPAPDEERGVSPDELRQVVAPQVDEFVFLCLAAAELAPGVAGVPDAVEVGALMALVRYVLLHAPPDTPLKTVRRNMRRWLAVAIDRVDEALKNAVVVPDPADMDIPDTIDEVVDIEPPPA